MAAFCSACGQPLTLDAKFCMGCGAPTTSPSVPLVYAPPGRQIGLPCKTCGIGPLRLEKRYRMSGPVVVIGYIFLIPSILGIIFSVLIVFGMANETDAGASAIAGGIGIFLAVAFFVGGLLGWLLVMKKKILCCPNCSAVVPAS